jgi:cobalamin biosynthesis protein CbiD
MGVGLAGTRRLMDRFRVESREGVGTMVELGKRLPRTAPAVDAAARRRIAAELARARPPEPARSWSGRTASC